MKWKKTFGEFLLLCVLILVVDIRQTVSLHPPPTEWTRTYRISDNRNVARSLIQTDDGGYAMLGFTQHWFTGWAYSMDFWLVKTDPAGNAEWNRTYGRPTIDDIESGQSLVQTDDGGYAMAGVTGIWGERIYFDIWLVKTDSMGNVEWNQTYGGDGDDFAASIVQTTDGGYAVAGARGTSTAGDRDIWLVKTDSMGNVEWNQTYGGPDSDWASSMVQTGDAGYLLAGITDSYGAGSRDIWLVKTDSMGNVEWNQTYGGTGMDWGHSAVQTSDGGYTIAGSTNSFSAGDYDFWLVKADSNGNAIWNQTYGGNQIDEAFSMVQTSDDGYALLGRTNSYGACDYWLVKTDSTGDSEWNQTYGGSLADIGYAIVQTVDGGYAMAGYSNHYISPSEGVVDFWLVKTGSGGDVNGDGVVNILDLSVVGLAYGSFEGDPNYNPEADLTEDGLVDAKDLAMVTLNYGKG